MVNILFLILKVKLHDNIHLNMSLPLPNEITIKCAGVLPYTYHPETKQLLFMLGQEDKSPGWVDSEKWSDFVGAPNKGENSHEEIAAREWWEETMGIYGTKVDYLALIRTRGIKVMPTPDVAIYLVQIPYSPEVVATYNNIYTHLTKCKVDHPIWPGAKHFPACPDGYAEKTHLGWFVYENIITEGSTIYRNSFWTSFTSTAMVKAFSML